MSFRRGPGMKLRKLELKDAPLMLEWMHDDDVVQNMKTNFKIKTLEDCEQFINESKVNNANLHLAIVDEFDEYMGIRNTYLTRCVVKKIGE